MSTTGSREEMLEALQKAKQAMSRRVLAGEQKETSAADVDVPQFNSTADDTPAHQRARAQVRSEAKENRSHFFDTWCRKIEMFIADPTKTLLELPKELAPNDRRELHALAEMYNLSHHSRGSGATRQLMLKKDALHYRMPDARPSSVDAIKQSAVSKQSKFHLRRALGDPNAAPGSIGTFVDGATADMVRRLERATDEYRRAVEVGYTQEELLALEAGQTVEEVLRLPGVSEGAAPPAAVTAHNTGSVSPQLPAGGADGTAIALGKRKVSYDEVCLRCGAQARVDYDVAKWECNGYCARCATQTVWRLVEVDAGAEEAVYAASNANNKRSRYEFESVVQPAEQQPEEIDKNNDEDDTVTVDDLVDMASMNDFCAEDINWIRLFAGHHMSNGENVLSKHIVFCIQFEDLFGMRIFRDFLSPRDVNESMDKQKRQRVEEDTANDQQATARTAWFVRLCEIKEANVLLSTLLEEVGSCIPEGYSRLAVAFPNMSVYGTAATCVCLIRPSSLQESSLESMQKRYGRRGICYGRELSLVLNSDESGA